MACAAEQGHLAAVGLQNGAPPCIDVYRAGPSSLELRAHLTRSPASLLSSVTALPGTSEFATGAILDISLMVIHQHLFGGYSFSVHLLKRAHL